MSYSTTSLSAATSVFFTDIPGSMGYTTDGGRALCVSLKGTRVQEVVRITWGVSLGTRMGPYLCSSVCLDRINRIAMLVTTRFHEQHDHRIPPAERLKHLCRPPERHYDLTGEDYYDQSALHVYGTTGGIRNERNTPSSACPVSRVSELVPTSSTI